MSDDETERVTVRVGCGLYADMAEVVESEDINQSQLVREGIELAVQRHRGEDVTDVVSRLEAATDDVQRQATRLERLPLE